MSWRGLLLALAATALVALPGYLAVLNGAGNPQPLSAGVAGTPAPREVVRPAAVERGHRVVSPQWVARMAARTGIPRPAMRAYAAAQLLSPCGVGWTTLAGIGWVESAHGTIGGRSLQPDGTSSSPILGPALDGHGRFAAIPATPLSRQWHHDPRWDHAVGPMQFLPSTWQTWAADGDGDGRADPRDLDDAALAAADYLCADGQDLTTGAGWSAAILTYNHEGRYVDAVHAAAVAYAERAAG